MSTERDGSRLVFVVNAFEDEDGDVSIVHSETVRAGVEADVAFALSELEVTTTRGEYDLAVIDLSLPHAAEAVAALAERLGTRVTFASMYFWRSCTVSPPVWSRRHIVYRDAGQFAAEVRAFANEFGI